MSEYVTQSTALVFMSEKGRQGSLVDEKHDVQPTAGGG